MLVQQALSINPNSRLSVKIKMRGNRVDITGGQLGPVVAPENTERWVTIFTKGGTHSGGTVNIKTGQFTPECNPDDVAQYEAVVRAAAAQYGEV